MTIEYLAGLIDGDGHMRLQHGKNRHGNKQVTPIVMITNTYKPVLDAVKKEFGGSVDPQKIKNPLPNRKKVWFWKIYNRNALALSKELLPHLHVKREQALHLLTFTQAPEVTITYAKAPNGKVHMLLDGEKWCGTRKNKHPLISNRNLTKPTCKSCYAKADLWGIV